MFCSFVKFMSKAEETSSLPYLSSRSKIVSSRSNLGPVHGPSVAKDVGRRLV